MNIKLFEREFFKNFKEKNSNKYSNLVLDSIFLNSKKVINKGTSFDLNNNLKFQNKSGIIVGKIQSGKTLNFIGLSFLALDNNCDIVIILTGTDNKLQSQTFTRINDYFNNWNSSLDFNRTEFLIKTTKELKTFNKHDLELLNLKIESKKLKLFIVSLKNTIHLKRIIHFLNTSNCNFKNKNILIIDDEADLASLDGNVRKREKDEYILKTKINKQISDGILKKINSYFYLSVTATPYIHYLLEESDSLKPDFIEILKPSNEYFGLKDFLNEENNCIKLIKDNSVDNILKHSFLPDSLKSAISFFIVYSYFYLKFFKNKKRTEMIINVAIKILDHEKIKDIIQEQFFDKYKDFAMNLIYKNLDENTYKYKESFLELRNIFKEPLDEIKRIKNITFNEKEMILNLSKFLLNRLSNPITINSKSDDLENNNNLNFSSFIYIGSNLIQRGITFSNLLISYFANMSKTSVLFDVLLQRARWLGYRQKYKEFIKVFTNENILNVYKEIYNANEEILEIILDQNKDDMSKIKDLSTHIKNKSYYYNNSLFFTNKRRYSDLKKDIFKDGFKIAQNQLYENTDVETDFINKYFNLAIERHFSNLTHKEYIFKNEKWMKKVEKFLKFIFKKFYLRNNLNLNNFFSKIQEKQLSFLILFMRNLSKERTLKCRSKNEEHKNCFIKDIYVGHVLGSKYVGDFYLYKEYDEKTVILQVHKINIDCKYNGLIKDKYFYFLYFPKT